MKTSSWFQTALRVLPLAALGVSLAGPIQAQATPATSSQISPAATIGNIDTPFLWRVEGAKGPSHLFGTIHAGITAAELPPIVGLALQHSSAFVMETIPSSSMIQAARASGTMAMDFDLALTAAGQHKPVMGLESLQFQLDLLNKIGGSEDLAAVLAEHPQAIEPLTKAYRTGELSEILTQTATDAFTQELLLTSRNHAWVDKLDSGLRRGGLFVAVGVGHFPGEEGVLQLLNQRGFNPTQIGHTT